MADILADVIVSQITETASSNTQISRAGIGRTASDRARARAASEASTASDRHEAMVRFSKRWACSFGPPLSTSDADQKDATTNPLSSIPAPSAPTQALPEETQPPLRTPRIFRGLFRLLSVCGISPPATSKLFWSTYGCTFRANPRQKPPPLHH